MRAHIARGLPTPLAGKAAQEIGFPEIVTAVRRKDRIVTEIFERWLDRFSATILNGFYAYTPDLILLAGGPPGCRHFSEEARSGSTPPRSGCPSATGFRSASRLADASWFGAALLARERFGGKSS